MTIEAVILDYNFIEFHIIARLELLLKLVK